ncbi:triacylglycerol lipase 2-like [Pyrus communis]|uniref:triacylglycerol lipase 2-like n=1 Tax=Pyrus communis TaxID=23211 RepID=UPI0035C04EFE
MVTSLVCKGCQLGSLLGNETAAKLPVLLHDGILTAYWDWSWDQLAAYDLPALFAYVNNQTGQKLHYVGHSLLPSPKETAKHTKISCIAALLAPVAYLGQMRSPFARTAVNAFLAQGPAFFFSLEFPNRCSKFCSISVQDRAVVASNHLTATTVLVHCNCEVSKVRKKAIQTGHVTVAGNIAMYDYVFPAINIQHYNQPTLPVYNMENIPKDVPLFLSYGGRDPLSNVLDVKYLLDNLRDHDKDKLVAQYTAEYAHMDFLMAESANQVVYAPLLDFFKLH